MMSSLKKLDKKIIENSDIIFCDSKEEYERLINLNLNENTYIKTISPTLLNLNKKNIHKLDLFWSKKLIYKYQSSINFFGEKIYKICKNDHKLEHEISLGIVLEVILFQRTLYYLLCISNEDLDKNILHISLNDNNEYGKIINLDWKTYLKDFEKFKYYNSNYKYKTFSKKNKFIPSLFTRILFAGNKIILSKFIIFVSKFFNFLFYKKNIYIHQINNSILDLIPIFFFKGYSINFINIKKKTFKNDRYVKGTIKPNIHFSLDIELTNKIKYELNKRILDFRPNINKLFLKRINEELIRLITIRVDTIFSFYEIFKKEINFNLKYKNFIFTNSPVNNTGLALSKLSTEFKISNFAFQHGVTQEIAEANKEGTILSEINASDIFVSYNNRYVEYNKKIKSIYCKGKILVTGMPNRNIALLKKLKKNYRNKKIMFISTNLYKGYFGQIATTYTDFERFKIEKNIIENILGKINHNVKYKFYPEINYRFVDEDPIYDILKKFRNITTINNKIDMRYLLNKSNIFITCKATSTVTWPLLTNKPTILINIENNCHLLSDVYELFKKGIFIFDYNDVNFSNKLRSFLELPLSEINDLWFNKEKDRMYLIKEIFSTNLLGSEKIFYNFIKDNYF